MSAQVMSDGRADPTSATYRDPHATGGRFGSPRRHTGPGIGAALHAGTQNLSLRVCVHHIVAADRLDHAPRRRIHSPAAHLSGPSPGSCGLRGSSPQGCRHVPSIGPQRCRSHISGPLPGSPAAALGRRYQEAVRPTPACSRRPRPLHRPGSAHGTSPDPPSRRLVPLSPTRLRRRRKGKRAHPCDHGSAPRAPPTSLAEPFPSRSPPRSAHEPRRSSRARRASTCLRDRPVLFRVGQA